MSTWTFARELKKTVEHESGGYTNALVTVTEILVKGLKDLKIRGLVMTTPTTALLRSARIMRRVLDTLEDLLSLRLW